MCLLPVVHFYLCMTGSSISLVVLLIELPRILERGKRTNVGTTSFMDVVQRLCQTICAIDILVATGRIIQLSADYTSLCGPNLHSHAEYSAMFLAYDSPFLQGMLHSFLMVIIFLSGGLHYPTNFSMVTLNLAIFIIILWYIFVVVSNSVPAVMPYYMRIQLTTAIIFIGAPVLALIRAKCFSQLHNTDGPEGVSNTPASKNLEARLIYVLKIYLLLWLLSVFGLVLCFADRSLCSRNDARGMISEFFQVPTTLVGGFDAILLGGGLTSYRKRLNTLARRLRLARRRKQARPQEPLGEASSPPSAGGVKAEIADSGPKQRRQSGSQDGKEELNEPSEVKAFLKLISEW